MNNILTQRLVEMTFAPLTEVAEWLTRLGMEVQRQKEGVVTVHNPYLDITTAILSDSDPISRAVCLGFALAGVHWPGLCPRLLNAVNKEWRSRRKQAAANISPVGPPPGREKSRSHPARQPFPMAAPIFTDLYKTEPR